MLIVRASRRTQGGTVSVLRINISKLSEGTHHHSLTATPEEVGLDSRFSKPVTVEVTLEKTSRHLYMHVQAATGGVFTCDRCIEEFQKDVAAEYGVMVVSDAHAPSSDSEEVLVISPDTTHLDLADDVRQFVLLGVPPKILCREECAGLCPACGSNLNRGKCNCQTEESDSPWSELQKLKN